MLPTELESRQRNLPGARDGRIIILTGPALRHRRFGLRLIDEFGDRIVAWYEVTYPPSSKKAIVGKLRGLLERQSAGIGGIPTLSVLSRYVELYGLSRVVSDGIAPFRNAWANFRFQRQIARSDEVVFRDEVTRLEKRIRRSAEKIPVEEINSPEFAENLKQHRAYFLCTLGGPIYGKPVLESVSGLAINQHAGHSPNFKGSNTSDWALFHRMLDKVSSTVHITETGADSGAIIRRSNPCLFSEDEAPKIFSRVVALGTELMIECIRDISANESVTTYLQPADAGVTYTSLDFNYRLYASLRNDHRSGLYRDLMSARRKV